MEKKTGWCLRNLVEDGDREREWEREGMRQSGRGRFYIKKLYGADGMVERTGLNNECEEGKNVNCE